MCLPGTDHAVRTRCGGHIPALMILFYWNSGARLIRGLKLMLILPCDSNWGIFLTTTKGKFLLDHRGNKNLKGLCRALDSFLVPFDTFLVPMCTSKGCSCCQPKCAGSVTPKQGWAQRCQSIGCFLICWRYGAAYEIGMPREEGENRRPRQEYKCLMLDRQADAEGSLQIPKDSGSG